MKYIPVPVCLATILVLSGCARMKVSCETMDSYAFGQIRTYQWVEAPGEILEQDDTYLNEDLQKALNNELAARGWLQVLGTSNATIQVTYYVKIKAHEEYVETAPKSESDFSGGLVYKKGQWNYEEREPDQHVYTVETGTLNMQVCDTVSGTRIWNGMLRTKIDRSAPIEKQHELFHMAARKLLAELPPEPRR